MVLADATLELILETVNCLGTLLNSVNFWVYLLMTRLSFLVYTPDDQLGYPMPAYPPQIVAIYPITHRLCRKALNFGEAGSCFEIRPWGEYRSSGI